MDAKGDRMSELVVVGGGIGGLSTALSSARRGHRVMVLERGEFAEFGAESSWPPTESRR
jgi:glycine/D-amino acid oxidase-like deaminating enzyme